MKNVRNNFIVLEMFFCRVGEGAGGKLSLCSHLGYVNDTAYIN